MCQPVPDLANDETMRARFRLLGWARLSHGTAGMRRMGIGWAGLLVVGMSACATDDAPTFDGSGTIVIDEDTLPEALSQAQCEAQMDCDCLTVAGPVGEDPVAHTMATCLDHRRSEIEFWQKGAHFYELTFDPTCLARRLADLREVGCGDQFAWSAIRAGGSCADRCRIYHGDIAAGQACDLSEGVDRCGQGLFCDWSWDETISDYSGTCKQTCVPDGASCLHAGCAPGSQCIDWVCEPAPHVGDACPDYWCLDGYCNPGTLVCEAPLSPGESCVGNPGACTWGCINGVCAEGSAYVCGWDFREPYGYPYY